jgi:hypothetical protein
LHVLRSTKRLREAEDLRGFCVAFSSSGLLTVFIGSHDSSYLAAAIVLGL